MMRPLELALKW